MVAPKVPTKSLRKPSTSSRASSTSASVSASAASDTESYYEEITTGSSSKRRRLSPHRSDDSEEDTPPLPAPAISRIKPRANGIPTQSPTGLVLLKSNGNFDSSTLVAEKTSFATLDVAPWLVASLSAMAIMKPTGIQKGCIREILKGKDVIGGSRTGSGKTVAFAVPILQKWAEDPVGIFAVVLTPTRQAHSPDLSQIANSVR